MNYLSTSVNVFSVLNIVVTESMNRYKSDPCVNFVVFCSNAPPVLAAAVARAVADRILSENMDTYLEEKLVEQPQWEGEEPVADEQCK